MVNVVEELHVRRIYLLHHAHAPCGVIRHIVRVVHLAVQQLQADCDSIVLGDLLHTVQSGDRIARAFIVRHPFPGSREGDHVGHTGFCC